MEITLDMIMAAVAALVGFPALWALVIDVLKHFGIVDDGTSGKWSGIFNLVSFTVVAIALNFFPQFDLKGFDIQLAEIVKLVGYIIGLLFELFGTKAFHAVATKPLMAKLVGGKVA